MNKIQGAAAAFIQATKGDVVSDEEISRRARICKPCPGKVLATGMGRVSQILGKVANENRVDKNISDYKCSCCGCAMLLLLPAKEPHVDSEREKKRRMKVNPNCWMLK